MYLLKTKAKENNEFKVAIGIKSNYHEFHRLEDLIRFLFENSSFIENYLILEAKEYSSECSNEGNNCISLKNSNPTFNLNAKESYGKFL